MFELKYRLRSDKEGEPQANPKGRPYVYFTCHPVDFDRYFDSVCQELFATHNCAVWYDPEHGARRTEHECEVQYAEMTLFVIPVTTKFLTEDSRARDDFKFAIEHHRPILPLMQENGLDELFARVCGDLQYLNRHEQDKTAIPYEEKLKKFLDSILISDEMAEKVRKAFDAYIFLSYRKKDREYAQKLMRLIHKNDFCRDIAIWYDEYLVPGENFNTAILDAIKKSDLFALVVTPKLLEKPNEKPNYVMKPEYPEAKKAGKAILPVEMLSTEKDRLAMEFDGIPTPIAGENEVLLRQSLSEQFTELAKKFAMADNDNDPEHLFFIGLAYLSGIDVEVDYEKALALITKAAQGELPEAIEKLVAMYRSGEGVTRRYEKAIEWQQALVKVKEKAFAKNCTYDSFVDLFNTVWRLGDYQKELVRLEKANETYRKMLALCEKWQESFDCRRCLSVSLDKLGDIAMANGDLKAARAYFERSFAIDAALAAETATAQAIRDLSLSLNKLGDIAEANGDLKAARAYFERSLALREALADKTGTAQARRDLSVSLNHLGDIAEASGDLKAARAYFERSLALQEALADETGTAQARRDLSVSLNQLGDIAEASGELKAARAYFERSLALREALVDETDTAQARRDLSVSLEKLGNIAMASGDLKAARAYFERSLALAEALADKTDTVEAYDDLAVSYYKLGLTINEKEYLQKAYDIWASLAKAHPEVAEFGRRRDIAKTTLDEIDE